MARTNADDSTVHGRTVSVLPSLYSRVIDASYVRSNLPMFYNTHLQLHTSHTSGYFNLKQISVTAHTPIHKFCGDSYIRLVLCVCVCIWKLLWLQFLR